jgi:hypothetical protein
MWRVVFWRVRCLSATTGTGLGKDASWRSRIPDRRTRGCGSLCRRGCGRGTGSRKTDRLRASATRTRSLPRLAFQFNGAFGKRLCARRHRFHECGRSRSAVSAESPPCAVSNGSTPRATRLRRGSGLASGPPRLLLPRVRLGWNSCRFAESTHCNCVAQRPGVPVALVLKAIEQSSPYKAGLILFLHDHVPQTPTQ